MIAPNSSQRKLQTVTQWCYCHGTCQRSTPMRRIAGDSVWQCPYCGYHEPEPTAAITTVQTSAPAEGATAQGAATDGQ
jgi:ribosomal protein L37AE/L43A